MTDGGGRPAKAIVLSRHFERAINEHRMRRGEAKTDIERLTKELNEPGKTGDEREVSGHG